MSPRFDNPGSAGSARAQLIEQVVAECIHRRSSGERLPDDVVIASHADLMPELGVELRKLRLVELARRDAKQDDTRPETVVLHTERERRPQKFPGYEVVREIHHGGQGTVFLAIQLSTKRKVALKVLHGGAFAEPRARARLEREVQILTHLNHPNVVRVHDSGVADGCPFYVMDYISGSTLDAYLGQDGHTLPELLRLFLKICDALAAAHLCGVIHRDIKPSNVRVDANGAPYVLDFGLARLALEDVAGDAAPEVLSMTGQFIGSLPWASPEQATGLPGRVDIRTDVYSLGVVLYQMLTGQMPYEVVGQVRDVLDRIQHAEPARPSTALRAARSRSSSAPVALAPCVASSLRRFVASPWDDDLDTIVLKCLAKDRARRYQSAGELARDLRHYLAGEPIEAKRDSLAYVLRKQLRRHRWPVAAGTAVAFSVAAGLVLSVTFWQHAEHERQAARRSADRAELVADFLDDVLTSIDPEETEADRDSPLYQSLRETLERAGARADQLAGQPEVEARVRHTLGQLYMNLGLYAAAEPHLRRAAELRSMSAAAARAPWTDTLLVLGWCLKEQGQYAEAERAYQAALAARTALFGHDGLPVAELYNCLGQLHFDRKDYAQAEPYLRDALALRQRLGAAQGDVANSLANLGSLLRDAGRLTDAEPLLTQALEIRRALHGDRHHETLVSLNKLALLRRAQGQHAEARQLFEQYVAGARETLGAQHAHVAVGLTNLGLALYDEADYPQAEQCFRQAEALFRRTRGETHPQVAEALLNLGNALRMQGRGEEAAAECARALDLLTPADPRRARGLLLRGQLLCDAGEAAAAQPVLEEAQRICIETYGPEHVQTQRVAQVLAGCLPPRN